MGVSTFKYSDPGPREENQDALESTEFNGTHIACVADGVGGNNCGKFAAQSSVKFFQEGNPTATNLSDLLQNVHNQICSLQQSMIECAGMASTFTACLIQNYELTGVHTGDSRLCILRGNGIKQLTDEHTELNRLIKAGKVKKEQAADYPRKNVLESALGIKSNLQIQAFDFKLQKGDRIILTTDGVHEVTTKVQFRDLSLQAATIELYGQYIIEHLKNQKLTDNVSFVVLEVT